MDSNTFNHYTTIGKVVFKLHNVDLMGWFLAECMSYVGLNDINPITVISRLLDWMYDLK